MHIDKKKDTIISEADRLMLVLSEREKHYKKEGTTYSWEEVKEMAVGLLESPGKKRTE
jgi:hypothetical protein